MAGGAVNAPRKLFYVIVVFEDLGFAAAISYQQQQQRHDLDMDTYTWKNNSVWCHGGVMEPCF